MDMENDRRPTDWGVGLRVWLDYAGQVVLGPGRLELLEGIERWHSISEAARRMGMSYRRAWILVQDMNRAGQQPLVEAAVGGTRGGGARLTPQGRELAAVFRRLRDRLHATATALLPEALGRTAPNWAVQVAAASSLEGVLGRLLADLAVDQPPFSVRTLFAASDVLADQLLAGLSADLLLTADEVQLDRLAALGVIEPASRVSLACNNLVVIGAAEQGPSVRKPADLIQPRVTRIACAKPGTPLGNYSRAYLERLGLYEALQPRLLLVDNANMVVPAVHGGLADVGLVYGSEAAAASGCRILFRAPRSAAPIRFAGGLVCGSRRREHASRLLDFLTSRRAKRCFRLCGFLPARRG
jgi:molybdenum ABC transporter molybdate-binding protein